MTRLNNDPPCTLSRRVISRWEQPGQVSVEINTEGDRRRSCDARKLNV